MNAHTMATAGAPVTQKGEVLLSVESVSLRFGGVKAITDVSFDIRKGEVRAIIGPNGAGKTSMLNCINGFYHPQEGRITYKGVRRSKVRPHQAAAAGIARTFQNVALFKGMSTLDNIMTGRTLKMRGNLFWQLFRQGPAMDEEIAHRKVVEDIIDTGLTLTYLMRNLASRKPASLEIMAMFRKPDAMKAKIDVAYVGFDLPNQFVVGYGLDYAGRYRNLRDVGILAPHVYS